MSGIALVNRMALARFSPESPRPSAEAEGEAEAEGQAEATSRALVPVAPNSPRRTGPDAPYGRSAVFLAQLIANAQHLPQTRLRRRAHSAEGAAAYRIAAAKFGPSRARPVREI